MPEQPPSALVTDLYELTMAAGYFAAGKAHDRATFELFVRGLPPHRRFVLAAGLEQAVHYLLNLKFQPEEIEYLKGLSQFAAAPAEFFEMLAGLRFTGDLFAAPEGTPLFAGEPFLTLRAPLIEAQLIETCLLSIIGFQSMVASKAARVVRAAGAHKGIGSTVVEFGTRRAHSPEAGVLAGRASYIGGCIGTSNTESGMRYGIPVFGTAAHSWTMAFPAERIAFEKLQRLLGDQTVYLVDTYDTLEGVRTAAQLGRPLWGVRLDSGNLVELAPAARTILDDAGLSDAKIMASGDLNEYKINELVAARAPIDAYGVGTDLAVSADAPSLSVVYKMVEVDGPDGRRYPFKMSRDKRTLPGAKQVFRYADHDVIGLYTECPSYEDPDEMSGSRRKRPTPRTDCEALQRPVILQGQLLGRLPTATEAREHAAASLAKLPKSLLSLFEDADDWPVKYSTELESLYKRAREEHLQEEDLARPGVGEV